MAGVTGAAVVPYWAWYFACHWVILLSTWVARVSPALARVWRFDWICCSWAWAAVSPRTERFTMLRRCLILFRFPWYWACWAYWGYWGYWPRMRERESSSHCPPSFAIASSSSLRSCPKIWVG